MVPDPAKNPDENLEDKKEHQKPEEDLTRRQFTTPISISEYSYPLVDLHISSHFLNDVHELPIIQKPPPVQQGSKY